MMKNILSTIVLGCVAAALCLLSSCSREPQEEPDSRVLAFSLEVANQDYTQTTVLDGVGDTQIASLTGQPDWVKSISRQEQLYNGKLVLEVTVTADSKINWNRSADIVIGMNSGLTVNLTVSQRPGLPNFNSGALGGASPSVNKAFEEDWSSQTEIEVVTSVSIVNNVSEVRKKSVFLPWNFTDVGVQRHIPEDELLKMMKYKYDWALAFNTTGIETAAGANLNYFGLFNRYTHTLRVFYYWPEELVPPSGANDHLWHIRFSGSQAEYNPTAFAVPLKHSLEGADAARFQNYASTFYTTPLTNEMGKENTNIVVPAPGWWAFDMDMSAMRAQSFFDGYDERNMITIGLDLFDEQSVVLKSIFEGTMSGSVTGNMNLQGLIPTSANGWGKIVPSITGPLASTATSVYLLNGITDPDKWSNFSLIPMGIGLVLNIAGNFAQQYGKNTPKNAEEMKKQLGDLNAEVNLTMSGTISTTGEIRSQRSHNIPSLSLPIGYLSKIRNNSEFQMGRGLWNIENDPVVYVVKDALWANKPVLTYYSRKQQSWYRMGNEVAEYDISSSPTSLGLRVISFLDPTSLGDVVLNEHIFGNISNIRVGVSYGLYPGGEAGITDAFRSAAGLDYEPMSLATSGKDQRASTGDVAGTTKLPLKIFKDNYTKEFFQMEIDEEEKAQAADLIGTRLSAQKVNDAYERRYYGSSLFFTNPDVSASQVDIVQYVADPQIFVPFDEKRRVITDPDLPDLVVTVQLCVESQSPGEEEPGFKVYTLRYLPRIEYINAEDVPALYQQMAAKANGGMSSQVNYATLKQHLGLVKAYADEISAQLAQ